MKLYMKKNLVLVSDKTQITRKTIITFSSYPLGSYIFSLGSHRG